MATETEQLVVSLEARIRDFEKNFQRAKRTADQNFDAIERRAKQSGDRLEASMSKASQGVNLAMAAMKGGLAGLAAGLSMGTLSGIVNRVGDIAKGVASIGDEARRAGLSAKAFQEFKHVADQNRIGVDALTDGFKELSLRADEFIVTGKGSAAEAFTRLGFSAQELKRKLQDPSALFTEIIGKLGQLDKAAQIRIADELFGGTGGEQFVQIIAQGEAGLRATVQQAHDLGLVLDDEVIAKADEIDRKFNLLSRTVGTKLKGAVVEVATGMASDFAGKLAKMLASMPDDLKGSVTINSGYRSPERQQELWLQALQKYGSPEAARKWVAPPGNSQHNKGNAADLGYSSDAARSWMHANAGSYGLSFPLANEDWHIEDTDARGQQRAEDVQRQAQALTDQAAAYRQIITDGQQYIQAQGTEQQALGMTAQQAAKLRYEQDLLNQAQRAGIALTPTQRQEIETLAQGMASAEAATTSYAQTQEEAAAVSGYFAQSAGDALIDVITGATSAEDALKRLIASFAQAALQAALLGQGPLAGLLGGGGQNNGTGGILGALFSGIFGMKNGGLVQAFAGGGQVRGPGGPREDKVPAWLSDGEFVVNADATSKNRAALEAINSGRTPVLSAKIGGKGGAATQHVVNTFAPTIPITVQASGNRETDAVMAERLTKEMDTLLEAKMTEFVETQQRPGNMLNRKGFI